MALQAPDGSYRVTIVNAETPVELTGDVVLDTFGALDDASETDPDAASATIPSLLRGILETLVLINTALTAVNSELDAQTALLTDIETNTTPDP